ncbi:MAG: NUDIX hydrolase [Candidatus Eremiobacteraeota bacterium]|nr:NUDIX hydrolase [Candidatus Eremiobacteraeota bacterium]
MDTFERRSSRRIYENRHVAVEVHEIVRRSGAAGEHVLIVTPPATAVLIGDGGDFLFARQPRFGARAETLELVKGGAESGESALDCAKREAREELGVVAARWESLGQLLEIPSIMNSPVELYYAHGIEHVDPSGDEEEQVALVRIPADVALRAAASGQINDAVTLAALLRHGLRANLLRL